MIATYILNYSLSLSNDCPVSNLLNWLSNKANLSCTIARQNQFDANIEWRANNAVGILPILITTTNNNVETKYYKWDAVNYLLQFDCNRELTPLCQPSEFTTLQLLCDQIFETIIRLKVEICHRHKHLQSIQYQHWQIQNLRVLLDEIIKLLPANSLFNYYNILFYLIVELYVNNASITKIDAPKELIMWQREFNEAYPQIHSINEPKIESEQVESDSLLAIFGY